MKRCHPIGFRLAVLVYGLLLQCPIVTYAETSAATKPSILGVAGKLQEIGKYPYLKKGYSATQLPDGRILLVGVDRVGGRLGTETTKILRERRKRGVIGQYLKDPLLWNPKRSAWKKLSPPPECKNQPFLHTATLLPNGQTLFAGGLCDEAKLATDASPHAPYHPMSLWDSATERWQSAPSLVTPRIFHTATLLPDTSVLIVGGESDPSLETEEEPVLDSVERFTKGKVEVAASLTFARAKHTATLLLNSSLLVVGGVDRAGKAIASVEQWDTIKNEWQSMAPLKIARYGHSATLLDHGRVMVAGGVNTEGEAINAVEIFDPSQNTWSDAQPLLVPLHGHAATRLSNGDVLVMGGLTLNSASNLLAMSWDEAAAQWHPAGDRAPSSSDTQSHAVSLFPKPDGTALVFGFLSILHWSPGDRLPKGDSIYGARMYHSTTLATTGQIMLVGGRAKNIPVDWAEIYDPASGSFSYTGRINQPRYSHSAIALDNGGIVIAGGWVPTSGKRNEPTANSPEVWDPHFGRWRIIKDIRFEWRERVRLGKLRNGSVLFFASRDLTLEDEQGLPEFRAWIWNPYDGKVEHKEVSVNARTDAGIAILPNGGVLIVGGKIRTFVPAQKCPQDSRSENRAPDEEEDCRDEPSYWSAEHVQTAEIWDSESGAVIATQRPPDIHVLSQSLVLKNGDALFTDYIPANPYARTSLVPVLIWHALTGQWTSLPRLDANSMWSMTELNDGSLLTPNHILPPGETTWLPTQAIQENDRQPIELPSGRLLSLSSQAPYVTEFDKGNKKWSSATVIYSLPKWNSPPVLVALPDRRVMAIGQAGSGSDVVQTAHIWNPSSNSWTTAGQLARRYGSGSQAVLLPSGQVLHVGSFDEKTHICEVWQPGTTTWKFCNTFTLADPIRRQNPLNPYKEDLPVYAAILETIEDGRAAWTMQDEEVFVYNELDDKWSRMKAEWDKTPLAYGAPIRPKKPLVRVFDETRNQWFDASKLGERLWMAQGRDNAQANALWDAKKKEWAYVFRWKVTEMGGDAIFLSDGCAFSWSGMTIFNPHTGKVTRVSDPGISIDSNQGSIALLTNGTVVMAGMPVAGGAAGPGFFYRKIGCAGFEAKLADIAEMPSKMYVDVPISTDNRIPDVKPASYLNRLANFADTNRWVALALIGPLLLYVVIRRWAVPIFQRQNGKGAQPRDFSKPFRWSIRFIVYGVAIIICVSLLSNIMRAKRMEAAHECDNQPKNCLDAKTGILKPVPGSNGETSENSQETSIPCRFVGVWSSIRPGFVLRIKLRDNGQYIAAPNESGVGDRQGYTGFWAVQGNKMIWRHQQGNTSDADVNSIVNESDSTFTLIEMNGQRTRFEMIEATKSHICMP